MELSELIKKANLKEALEAVQADVRKSPAEGKHRVVLFQLLTVLGNWDRALTQLNVAADLDKKNLLMAQVCREALHCEVLRKEIFSGNKTPLVFGEPEEWVGWLVKANQLAANEDHKAAKKLRDQGFESAPAVSGSIDGKTFEWIADADTRLGPLLEAIVEGRYYWIPLSNISHIKFEEPSDLRDLVWTPANFVWKNGGNSVGLVPTRYCNSENSADPAIQLARKTEWIEGKEDLFIGVGQRMFATDQGEYPLLETREITLYHPNSEKEENDTE